MTQFIRISALIKAETYSALSDVMIEIVNVRKGSVIIEFSLGTYSQDLLDLALRNMNETSRV